MFKNKMYVYGLGVGLIVGAILLQLMNIAMHQPSSYTPAPADELDPTELQQQAAQHFQVFDKKTKVYTQPEFDEELLKRVQDENTKLVAELTPPKVAATVRTVIYIQDNLPAISVADLLHKSGIITDKVLFEEELVKQGITKKIQAGPHVFEGTPNHQEIINNLQSK